MDKSGPKKGSYPHKFAKQRFFGLVFVENTVDKVENCRKPIPGGKGRKTGAPGRFCPSVRPFGRRETGGKTRKETGQKNVIKSSLDKKPFDSQDADDIIKTAVSIKKERPGYGLYDGTRGAVCLHGIREGIERGNLV